MASEIEPGRGLTTKLTSDFPGRLSCLRTPSISDPTIFPVSQHVNVGRFAYKSFRRQVDSPTLTSIRLHDVSCFAYTSGGDSPTWLHGIFTVNNRYKCDQHLVYITIYRCDLYRIVRVLNCKGTTMIKSNPSFVLSNCSHPVHVGSFVFM